MRTLVFTAITLAALASFAAADPDPTNSITPEYIDLVGLHNGVPDPAGEFTVQVRDAVDAPVPGIEVSIDFSGCPDLSPASEQPYPGLAIDCGTRTVRATTDASGIARFVIVGSVLHREPASTTGCATIRANPGNVVLGQTSVAVYDQDGVNGVGGNDLALWFCGWCPLPILCPPQEPRKDYDHGVSSVQLDFINLVDRYFDGTSSATGTRCDAQPTVKTPEHASEGGLNLAWTSCSFTGGTSIQTFACDTNSGGRPLVFSMVAPPGITALHAFEAEAIIVGGDPDQPLPDWWRIEPGGCRGTSTSISSASGPAPCEGSGESGNVFARAFYPHVEQYGGKIRVIGAVTGPVALTAGEEYELFRYSIPNSKTTGTGACAGCDQPVQITFRSVKLIQGSCAEPATAIAAGEPDVLVDAPASSNRVYWQSTFTGVPQDENANDIRLARVGANPQGELTVEFTITTAAPVSLALFDVRGRRLAARNTAALGTQRVTLAKTGELRPGLYFVRLEQAGRSKLLKATVIP